MSILEMRRSTCRCDKSFTLAIRKNKSNIAKLCHVLALKFTFDCDNMLGFSQRAFASTCRFWCWNQHAKSNQVKSVYVKLHCSQTRNYAHNKSSQILHNKDILYKNKMKIVPLWKFAWWILIACGTKEERYRPVMADGKRMWPDLKISWPRSCRCIWVHKNQVSLFAKICVCREVCLIIIIFSPPANTPSAPTPIINNPTCTLYQQMPILHLPSVSAASLSPSPPLSSPCLGRRPLGSNGVTL